jgi:hypothetical protein
MKPTDHDQSLARLTAGARRAPRGTDAAAPFGFSTRVAALAFAAEGPMRSLLERFSLRAVGVASLLAVASVVVSYPVLTAHPVDDELIALEDPVAMLLEDGE